MENTKEVCRVCEKEVDYLERYYDRFGIYSGKACSNKCAKQLPGQGGMYNYEPEEPLEEKD